MIFTSIMLYIERQKDHHRATSNSERTHEGPINMIVTPKLINALIGLRFWLVRDGTDYQIIDAHGSILILISEDGQFRDTTAASIVLDRDEQEALVKRMLAPLGDVRSVLGGCHFTTTGENK